MKSLGERYADCLRRWVEDGAEPFLAAEVEALGVELDEQLIPWASVEEIHAGAVTRVGEACPAIPLATAAPRIADFLLAVGQARLVARRRRLRAESEEDLGAVLIDDQFLSLLVHELRNPLGPILAWSDLLQSGDLDDDEQRAEALDTVVRNGQLLGSMIDNVSVALRSRAALPELQLEPLDLAPLLSETVRRFDHAARSRGVGLEPLWEGVLPVQGQARALRQVLGNLIDNAVKFTPNGGTVEIEAHVNDSHVRVVVRDSGCGIPDADLESIFADTDAASRDTARHRGLGLGLSAARRLVEMHGGSLVAASEGEDAGAVFTLELVGAPLGLVLPAEAPGREIDAPRDAKPERETSNASEGANGSGSASAAAAVDLPASGANGPDGEHGNGLEQDAARSNGVAEGVAGGNGLESAAGGNGFEADAADGNGLSLEELLEDEDEDEDDYDAIDEDLDEEVPADFWDDEEDDEVSGVDERLRASRLWESRDVETGEPWSEESDDGGFGEAESGSDPATDSADTLPSEAPALPDGELAGVRILVVDDEPDATRATSVLLKRWGATVCETNSAEEALRELSRFRPGLLISDIAMPGHDGYALLTAVRRHEDRSGIHRLPAVALTVHSREPERRRALSAGFDAVVSKPIEATEFLATLELLLDQE